jgi:ATP-binding cassette subfamily G (WHITE) protein 1
MILIAYYMIGLTPAFSSYLLIATLGALAALCGNAYGTLLSALIDDIGVALAVAPLILLPLILVSGIFVAALPVYINWLKYISPIYYAFSGMMETQFSQDIPNCDPSQGPCSKRDVFAELSFVSTFSAGVDIVFLCTIFAVLWVAGFFALYWGAHRKR